ncbi:hypothetical protein F5Y08DRAFT_315642 [Xylaria arbuscula]|nr:hypothetical protein F5Y08DRAFT_315642 [Xylaria arbuscula]
MQLAMIQWASSAVQPAFCPMRWAPFRVRASSYEKKSLLFSACCSAFPVPLAFLTNRVIQTRDDNSHEDSLPVRGRGGPNNAATNDADMDLFVSTEFVFLMFVFVFPLLFFRVIRGAQQI